MIPAGLILYVVGFVFLAFEVKRRRLGDPDWAAVAFWPLVIVVEASLRADAWLRKWADDE